MLLINMIGLGTYKLDNDTTFNIVQEALKLGYRIIDTAQLYENEESVGKAIRESQIDRNEIFVITKIWLTNIEQGKQSIINSVINSLNKLDIGYIDALLLHGPVKDKIIESWIVMQDIFLDKIDELKGKIKSIGVSNYDIPDLEILLENCDIVPAHNQIEISPFCKRQQLIEYCKSKNIEIIAHSSLTKGKMFNHMAIQQLCSKYNCKPSKILLNWSLSKGYIVLPRTSNLNHLKENFDHNLILNKRDISMLDTINEIFYTHPQYA